MQTVGGADSQMFMYLTVKCNKCGNNSKLWSFSSVVIYGERKVLTWFFNAGMFRAFEHN